MMVDSDKQLKIPTEADRRRARRRRLLRNPYWIWALLCYSVISVALVLYLNKTPVYSSEMSLVLPGSGSSSSVRLNEVGHATSQTNSPFNSAAFNPRVNYKEIIRGREVINAAAEKIEQTAANFGIPKVLLTEQTSILQVEVRALTGKAAQEKAWALYEAFQGYLDQLRADEAMRRDQSVIRVLDGYRTHLETARQALVEFQQSSMVVSMDQLGQMTVQIDKIKSDVMYSEAEISQKQQVVNQLSYDLGVSPDMAGKAFKLQTDTQFMGHLRELNESAQQTSEYASVWGKNHPKVKASEKRMSKAEDAAYSRSAALLGSGTAQSLHTVNLGSSPERASLFKDLIDTYAQMKGQEARVAELRLSQARLQDEIKIMVRESKELQRLEREYELAEAVFTSTAAELEAGKSDVFASYPVIQLMGAPNEPIQQSSPSLKIATAGAGLGYLFVTSVILIIWQREYLLQHLLRRK